jgi:hypothetical protein
MNTTVTATGMQVTAVTNQLFLQIVGEGEDFDDDTAQTTKAAATNSTKYSPTNVYSEFSETEPEAFAGNGSIVWVSSNSNDPAKSGKEDGYTGLKYTDVTGSVASYAFRTGYKLRLNPATKGEAPNGTNLQISSVSISAGYAEYADDNFLNCVSVLIKCGNLSALYKQESQSANSQTLKAVANSKEFLTTGKFPSYSNEGGSETGVVNVEVYVFFDGDNLNCTTNKVTTDTYAVDVAFTLADDGTNV